LAQNIFNKVQNLETGSEKVSVRLDVIFIFNCCNKVWEMQNVSENLLKENSSNKNVHTWLDAKLHGHSETL